MRDSTKLYIETELNHHIKVNMKKCAENDYDWFDYFVDKDIKEDNLECIEKCFYDYNMTHPEEELDKCDFSLIQLRVAETLFKNGGSPNKVKKAHLFLDPEVDFSGNWSNDPGYEESYCIGGDCYLILEGEDADYILRVDSDYYDSCDLSLEAADFIAKFEE